MSDSVDRIGAAEVERLIPRIDDPPPDAVAILIYSRPVDDVLRTLARFPSGKIIIIL